METFKEHLSSLKEAVRVDTKVDTKVDTDAKEPPPEEVEEDAFDDAPPMVEKKKPTNESILKRLQARRAV